LHWIAVAVYLNQLIWLNLCCCVDLCIASNIFYVIILCLSVFLRILILLLLLSIKTLLSCRGFQHSLQMYWSFNVVTLFCLVLLVGICVSGCGKKKKCCFFSLAFTLWTCLSLFVLIINSCEEKQLSCKILCVKSVLYSIVIWPV